MKEPKQLYSIKVDSATIGRIRRIAKREARTQQTIMHRAVRAYDEQARSAAAARRRGDTL